MATSSHATCAWMRWARPGPDACLGHEVPRAGVDHYRRSLPALILMVDWCGSVWNRHD